MQGEDVPHTLRRVPLSGVGAVVSAKHEVASPTSTTTQVDVKSLKSIRDDLTSLLQEASPVEAQRLRKIIGDLNAGIPVSVTLSLANFIILRTK